MPADCLLASLLVRLTGFLTPLPGLRVTIGGGGGGGGRGRGGSGGGVGPASPGLCLAGQCPVPSSSSIPNLPSVLSPAPLSACPHPQFTRSPVAIAPLTLAPFLSQPARLFHSHPAILNHLPPSTCSMSASSHPVKHQVAIIGSGNWGSAIAKLAAQNAATHSDVFQRDVPMWVYEEQVDGRNLTSIINDDHENVKYLPGVKLPENLRAVPSLIDACRSADMLVFCLPHQFIPNICRQLREAAVVAKGAFAISLTKGVDVKGEEIKIIADVIEEELGTSCAALSGANIANEVALNKFSETTIGYRIRSEGELWQKLFHTPQFHVQIIEDRAGVSLCGALKNVVAVAAGFCDGLGWGNNAKAAVMRIGLLEMKNFSMEFFSGVKTETFVQESAGIADLITTCFGGRNRLCAEAYVKTGKPFQQLETELLGGQKLQGVATAEELHRFLKARGRVDGYPLFHVVYKIAFENLDPSKMTAHL